MEVMDSYGYEGEESGADGRDGKELEVTGIYTPVLENGERTTDVAMESENKYN